MEASGELDGHGFQRAEFAIIGLMGLSTRFTKAARVDSP